MAPSIYQYNCETINGETHNLEAYQGNVLLIVNTASQCGFTPQYQGLQALYEEFHDKGFEVLGFPCNQFGAQEKGSHQEISQFCELNYGVTFPLFAKINVNGPQAHPLYQHLKKEAKGLLGSEAIKWNFTKFLVNREGNVVRRYGPTETPEKIRAHIHSLVNNK
jgi:glutathione peroxidase